MKCIKHAGTGEIIRVDDVIANRMVNSVGKQKYNYVSKSEWKAATRPAKEEVKK